MDTATQEALGDLLNAYFGYQADEDGVGMMASVAARHAEVHQQQLATLAAGQAAAARGDTWVVGCVRRSYGRLVETPAEAERYLAGLLAAYTAAYAAARARLAPPDAAGGEQ